MCLRAISKTGRSKSFYSFVVVPPPRIFLRVWFKAVWLSTAALTECQAVLKVNQLFRSVRDVVRALRIKKDGPGRGRTCASHCLVALRSIRDRRSPGESNSRIQDHEVAHGTRREECTTPTTHSSLGNLHSGYIQWFLGVTYCTLTFRWCFPPFWCLLGGNVLSGSVYFPAVLPLD